MKPHEFVYNGKKYGLRVVNKDGTSHGGFKNSLEIGAKIEAPDWIENQSCGNGIHFCPLGSCHEGKDINDPSLIWMVISYESCVDLGGKCKSPFVIVEFVGNQAECYGFLNPMRIAFCEANSGSASNSGDYGSASNSGFLGSSSNSGDCGSASNSGDCGSASNSGYRGSASNSGYCGSASNSGYQGSASNSGFLGSSSNSGDCGSASNSGDCGSASNSGNFGSVCNSGVSGIASSTGIESKVYAKYGIACTTDKDTILSGETGVALVWRFDDIFLSTLVTQEMSNKLYKCIDGKLVEV